MPARYIILKINQYFIMKTKNINSIKNQIILVQTIYAVFKSYFLITQKKIEVVIEFVSNDNFPNILIEMNIQTIIKLFQYNLRSKKKN